MILMLNGKIDIVLGYSENGITYPVNGFDGTSRQIPVIRLRYNSYEEFAKATLQEIYGEQMLKSFFTLQGKYFCTSLD